MPMTPHHPTLAFATLLALVALHRPAELRAAPKTLDVELFYQYSASDDDAEVTIAIESDEPIAYVYVVAPDGHTVATARANDDLGLLEVELESAEPSVQEVQRAYPQGLYRFVGRSISGPRLFGRARLTHNVPPAPDFFDSPPCDEDVDADGAVSISWHAVGAAARGYEIIIEQDDTGANLRTTIDPDATTFTIPSGFLAPGLEYEIEMKTVNADGNKTSASCEFRTLDG